MVGENDKSNTSRSLEVEISKKLKNYKLNETMLTEFETISKSVYQAYEKSKGNSKGHKNIRVTDLCNPIHAYYDFKNPDLETPQELLKKFNYGKFAERRAQEILLSEKGFLVSQGDVDGSNCGMNEVKGRFDFRIENMIVEFKTSEYDIPDVAALFTKRPQDLEQLLIYILFTNRHNENHLLLYLIGKDLNKTPKAFKIKITDREKLIKYFSNRLHSLKNAIENDDPKGLGKCRYFDSLCKFRENQKCNCSQESELPIDTIQEATHITPFEGDIVNKFNNPPLMENYFHSFDLWDIFTPRRWLLKHSNPFDYFSWDDDKKKGNYDLRLKIEYELRNKELIISKNLAEDIPELSGGLFIEDKLQADKNPETHNKKFKPIIVRVQETKPANMNKLPDFYITQIGMACALSQSVKGYIFIFYINKRGGVLFEVTFDKMGNIRQKAQEIIKYSINSMKEKKLNDKLMECPEFARKNCYEDCLCTKSK